MKKTKSYTRIFLPLVVILFTSTGIAQNLIDSLKTELRYIRNIDSEINILLDIGFEYIENNSDSAEIYLLKVKRTLDSNPNTLLEAKFYKVLGLQKKRNGKITDAIINYKKGIHLFTEVDSLKSIPPLLSMIGTCFVDSMMYDSAIHYYQISRDMIDSVNNPFMLAVYYNNMANVYFYMYQQEKALKYYLNAATLFKEIKQYQKAAVALDNIGQINMDLRNYEIAIRYFKDAIELNKKYDNIYHLCMNYNNLGITYRSIHEYDTGKYYLNEAVKLSKAADFISLVAQSYNNLGSLYKEIEEYDTALVYCRKSLAVCRDIGLRLGEMYNLTNIGDIYINLQQYDSATKHLFLALKLAEKINDLNMQYFIYENLASAYEGLGMNKKAFEYYKSFETLKDSLINLENTKELNELQTKYDTEQKELENLKLRDQNKIHELTILRQRILMIAVLLIVILSIVILVVLFISRAKRKTQLILLEDKNKLIEEKSIQLKESNETKDKLFTIISHDLRGPFNSLIGFSTLLHEEVESGNYENVPMYSKQLVNTSNKTFELVDNLLNWSRSHLNKIETHMSSFILSELVKNSIETLLPTVIDKQIKVEVNINSDVEVFTDPDMLKVILRNLVSNAVKFTYKGGRIEIETVEEQNYYVVSVKDNGKGIDPEIADSIFKQTGNYTTPGTESESGSGLGLSIATDFVERLGGKIWVESEPEKGSTFSFSIPKKEG